MQADIKSVGYFLVGCADAISTRICLSLAVKGTAACVADLSEDLDSNSSFDTVLLEYHSSPLKIDRIPLEKTSSGSLR